MDTSVLERGGEASARCLTARAPDPDRVSMNGSGKHGLVDGVCQELLVERLEVAERGVGTELLVSGKGG